MKNLTPDRTRRTNQRQDEDEAKSNQIMDNLYIQFPVDSPLASAVAVMLFLLLQNSQERG